MIGVYIIKNKTNEKFYVGHSIDIMNRWHRHKSDLKRNCHHCLYLQRSWNKHGEENFEFIVIKECSLEESIELEQYYIDNYKDKTYNTGELATFGGDLISNNPRKDEIIEKQRETSLRIISSLTIEQRKEKFGSKGNKNPMFGKKHTLSTRLKMSQNRSISIPFNKNKKLEDVVGEEKANEIKAHLSELAKQKIGDKNPFYGKSHSVETKEKIRKANLGKKPPNMRKVLINGIIYESVTEAANEFGVVPATILNRIKSSNELYKDYSYFDDLKIE